jgi:hypothetical protein
MHCDGVRQQQAISRQRFPWRTSCLRPHSRHGSSVGVGRREPRRLA